jgi:chromosome segregation ATPase
MHTEFTALSSELEKERAERLALAERTDSLTQVESDLRDQLERLSAESDERVDRLEKDLAGLSAELEHEREEAGAHLARLQDVAEEVRAGAETAETARLESEQARAETGRLMSALVRLEEAQEEARKTAAETADARDLMSERGAAIKERLTATEETAREREEAIARLQGEVESSRGQLEAARVQAERAEGEAAGLRRRLEETQQTVAAGLFGSQEGGTGGGEQLQEIIRAEAAARAELERSQSEITAWQATIEAQEPKLAAAQEEHEESRRAAEKARAELSEFEDELTALTESVDRAAEDELRLQEEREETRQQVEEASSRDQAQQARAAEAEEQLTELLSRLYELVLRQIDGP